MKPLHALKVLDGRRRLIEGFREKMQPGTKKYEYISAEIAALEHACHLLAFEVQLRNQKLESGEYTSRIHKQPAFLQEVVREAPEVRA